MKMAKRGASRQSGSTLRNLCLRRAESQCFFNIRHHRNRRTSCTIGHLLVGLIAIPGGWKIVLVVVVSGSFFRPFVVKAFANAERKTGVSADPAEGKTSSTKLAEYFELLERLDLFWRRKGDCQRISEQARQGAKVRRKSLLPGLQSGGDLRAY